MPRTVANQAQLDAIDDLYNGQSFVFGVHKLYYKLRETQPQLNITRHMIEEWLRNNEQHQINRAQIDTQHINTIESSKPMVKLAVDLIDYSQQRAGNQAYVLVVIDIFSRYVYAKAIRTKTAIATRDAFRGIYNTRIQTRPTWNEVRVVNSDNGGEFLGEFDDWLQNNNIAHSTSIAGLPHEQ